MFSFDYTAFDGSTGLVVAAKIYNISTGLPVAIPGMIRLNHVLNGTYWAAYTNGVDDGGYLAQIAVYTDTTYTTLVQDYAPASFSRDALPQLDTILQQVQQVDSDVAQVGNNIESAISNISIPTPPVLIPSGQPFNNFPFPMTYQGQPVTGLQVTAKRQIDGGGFQSCTNSVVEVGNGLYQINLSATDMGGLKITLEFTASGADPLFVTIFTGA